MSAYELGRNAAFEARWPGFMAAVRRGYARQNEFMQLMETGTDEQIAVYWACNDAAFLADDMACAARRLISAESPEMQQLRQRMALRRAAEQFERAGQARHRHNYDA